MKWWELIFRKIIRNEERECLITGRNRQENTSDVYKQTPPTPAVDGVPKISPGGILSCEQGYSAGSLLGSDQLRGDASGSQGRGGASSSRTQFGSAMGGQKAMEPRCPFYGETETTSIGDM